MKAALLFLLLGALCELGTAWQRTKCGTQDLITQWGLEVNPNNVLPEYPRPQMARGTQSWQNLNGLWEFQPANEGDPVPYGKTLSEEILVPFPVESCLSGIGQNYKNLWYRLVFDKPSDFNLPRVLLHFGSVDWQTTVYFNGNQIGNNTGGYNHFSFDLTSSIKDSDNELILYVYDPSETGYQPHGKQFISAIDHPGGDVYTPASGIWQTVWLENVPDQYISDLTIVTDMKTLEITTQVAGTSSNAKVVYTVYDGNTQVATASGNPGTPVNISISSPKLWDPEAPFLYSLHINLSSDAVYSYFGLREVSLGWFSSPAVPATGPQYGIDRPGNDLPNMPFSLDENDPKLCMAQCQSNSACVAWAYANSTCFNTAKAQCWLKSNAGGSSSNPCRVSGAMAQPAHQARRPFINGRFLFLNGWLDQSFWPDGIYTAPTDAALAFDLTSVKTFGYNVVRLHQKVNPERWYYYADTLGIVILQDAVQKYGGATGATVQPFIDDITRMIQYKSNHPSIVQWEIFNEGDDVGVFDPPQLVSLVRQLDPTRLVDTNSGGPANDLHIADVNDIHSYPWPGHPVASATQYAMVGEYGGLGAFCEYSGIQQGVDLPGYDMPGSPLSIASANPSLCQQKCQQTTGCLAWAYGSNSAGCTPAGPLCWLKDGIPNVTRNDACRASGTVNHAWTGTGCGAYMSLPNPDAQMNTYLEMVNQIAAMKSVDLSVVIYTQITDVENECDGMLNYDRTSKFTPEQIQTLAAANRAVINQ